MRKCALCRSATDDELHLGKFHINSRLAVHEHCLYLSSNLVQRGKDRDHILYFTYNDILKEAERTRQQYCCYCQKHGANIGCCNTHCRKTFHTNCGVENGAQNEFVGTYRSYCDHHIRSYGRRPKSDEMCVICIEILYRNREKFSSTKHIYGRCCGSGWYHKDCLQRYANAAGYFFKCPLCNDSERFRLVAMWGISVPDRDAAWEENDAFADQLAVPTECTARRCVNATGRQGTKQTMLYCQLCGSNPKHMSCTASRRQDYCCDDCCAVENVEESDDEELDPLENFDLMNRSLGSANTNNNESHKNNDKFHPFKRRLDSSDTASDDDEVDLFETIASVSNSGSSTNNKENLVRLKAIPPVRRTPAQELRQAESRERNVGDTASRSKAYSPLVAEHRPRETTESPQNRVRSRSRPAAQSRPSERHSPYVIQRSAEPPMVLRERKRNRSTINDQLKGNRIFSPLDISCVAARTRARLHK